MNAPLLTEGDLDRGRAPDVAEHGPLRRIGSQEMPPDMCLRGHRPDHWIWGHDPLKGGRVFYCPVKGCGSVQSRWY